MISRKLSEEFSKILLCFAFLRILNFYNRKHENTAKNHKNLEIIDYSSIEIL